MEQFSDLKNTINKFISAETRVWYDRNPAFGEQFLALMRLILVILFLLLFILMGGDFFQNVNARDTAIRVRAISPLLHLVPMEIIAYVIYIFTWENLRYALPVFGAMVSVIIAGAFFVKDIYNLKQFNDGLRYILASLFAINLPHINIDNGQTQIGRKETNLIDAIGGPGYAMIQPGNAVLFHRLRKVSRNIITQSVLMTRFERIGAVTNLDDQDGYVEKMEDVVSRDGIQLIVREIRFRYRILSEIKNGKAVPRTRQNPYPFSRQAYIDLSYSLPVNQDKNQVTWGQAVSGMIKGVIEDYINSHTVDYLTAPRGHERDPRREINELMFGPALTNALSAAGTELHWVDIGHFDIVAEEVDRERVNLWAADWVGDAEKKKASSEANRQIYQELGRAEGQAEMLVGIAQSLSGIDLSNNRAQNIRHVILARTAQILEAMHDNRMEDSSPGGK